MFVNGQQLESGTALEYDICIIGGGPAGITIARELKSSGLSVCLLESGGRDFDLTNQELYEADLQNPVFPDTMMSRLRFFGGSTNHWEGACHPFSTSDFEYRPWVPDSGWPFSKRDLDPYYERAQTYCELSSYNYHAQDWAKKVDIPLLKLDPSKMRSEVQHHSTPTLFGWVYEDDFEQDVSVDVYLYSNVTRINAVGTGERIESVDVKVVRGPSFSVSAGLFVLATGGIENARILLASNNVHSDGIGNSHDVVGRYFMEHPVIEGAELYLTGTFDSRFYDFFVSDDRYYSGFLSLSEELASQRQLANVKMTMVEQSRYYLSRGISSFHQVKDDIANGDAPDNLWGHIGNIFSEIDMVGEAIYRKVFNRKFFDHANDKVGYLFDVMIEQTPDRENRVKLSGDRDVLGMPKPSIEWSLSSRDYENFWQCLGVLAEEVGRLGIGRLRLKREDKRLLTDLLSFGHHHMGTTRAGTNPRNSVVDENFKVHDLANLFVAGSSCFPTGGHVPPTLTIVATSIRLSEHLKSIAKGGV